MKLYISFMCGIFGFVAAKNTRLGRKQLKTAIRELFNLSTSRGKEAAGIFIRSGRKAFVYKKPIPGTQLVTRRFLDRIYSDYLNLTTGLTEAISVLGHARLATNGIEVKNHNNQPVVADSTVVVHNGIILNDSKLWKKYSHLKQNFEVDTEVFAALLSYFYNLGYSLEDAVRLTYAEVQGETSVGAAIDKCPYMILATNTGSIYYYDHKSPAFALFTSESFILRNILDRKPWSDLIKYPQIKHLHAGKAALVHLETAKTHVFKIDQKIDSVSNSKRTSYFEIKDLSDTDTEVSSQELLVLGRPNDVKKLQKYKPDIQKIRALKRCAKCILPVTMPMIDFDENGVCNYCRNHKKIRVAGKDALEKLLAPYRRNDGEPDCIVAFSGGRDSSYGLHYLKKEMKMNPIAYTYDWGMVTDLARRNQSRMVSSLGVEHVWVSADIRRKRQNIGKNVTAWLKQPDLGMVPLFMAGDKQAEYYAQELKKKTGIKLVIYCRGNEFENEEFKWGHCGIKEGSPRGVLHNLSVKGKLQLATYYGIKYLTNPAYINSSLWDTLFAYFVAYIMPLDFHYLWHYIMWDEEKITSTLINEYGWEKSTETETTWRIDDGSVPFYNYIYYTVQGFTENDTFRSNQIREGKMDRNTALKLVEGENAPRYQGLAWYFQQIGIDGEAALATIERIPKLY